MTSETYGGGSWDNPDHHARPLRPAAPEVKPEACCEAPGPDGWTCDLPPHRDDRHKADEGPSWGADWDTPSGNLEPLAQIHALAEEALESEDVGVLVWAKALREILELSRG